MNKLAIVLFATSLLLACVQNQQTKEKEETASESSLQTNFQESAPAEELDYDQLYQTSEEIARKVDSIVGVKQ